MQLKFYFMALTVVLVLIAWFLLSETKNNEKKITYTKLINREKMKPFSNSVNSFCFSLFKNIANKEQENVFFSPYSIHQCLMML